MDILMEFNCIKFYRTVKLSEKNLCFVHVFILFSVVMKEKEPRAETETQLYCLYIYDVYDVHVFRKIDRTLNLLIQ